MTKSSIGTIGAIGAVTAGTLFFMLVKRKKYVERFRDWKKEKIENMYYNNMDERDVAWG